MELDLDLLTQDVGLKYDEQVILGREKVLNFIESHADDFNDLDLSRIGESHMLYGYNKDHFPIKIGFSGEGIQRIVLVKNDSSFHRVRIDIAYDGHRYSGFQIQDKHLTVQGVLTEIISVINGLGTLIQGCSRTDTGVHANNYVCHFDTERDFSESRWLELLNYRLPNDIIVKKVEFVHPLFHSRYDVYKKRYIYKLRIGERDPFKSNYVWVVPKLNLDILETNLNQLVGTHDFLSFCKGQPDDTVRTVMKTKMKTKNDDIYLIFEGDGFLRYMIRIIVQALVEIASGKLSVDISEIIAEKNRQHTKHMAPASGLYLDEITY